MRFCWLTVLMLVGLTPIAKAQSTGLIEKVAFAGQVQRVGYINSINPDCSPTALPSASLLQAPRYGRITFKRGLNYSNYPQNNIRSRCNARPTNSLMTYYQPFVDAYVDDFFTIEYVDQNGNPRRFQYHVSIRPKMR